VNADGHREILGLQVTSAEDGAGWLGFFRDLTARGLAGVQLVTSDAHRGLVEAIGATLPGASWQRCRTMIGHTVPLSQAVGLTRQSANTDQHPQACGRSSRALFATQSATQFDLPWERSPRGSAVSFR
jgi:hypothetical protein